jgi:autotransporter-associated beta strand protein
LGGLNSYTGAFTNSSGTTTVNSGALLSGATANLTVNGGILNLNNAAQAVKNLSGAGGTINLGSGHTLTSTAIASSAFSGTIAGAGGFTKTDSFNQTLSGPNSYDGVTAISGTGTITVLSATGLGSTVGKTTVANGAGLNFNGGTTLTINEAIDIAGVGNTVATGGAINVGTAGTVITFGGPITLTADASVGSSGAAGTSVTFSNAAAFTGLGTTLTLNGAAGTGTKTISGAIALGIGGLTKLQSGTWVLSGTNTYNGATSISAGTLVAASNAALGSAAAGTTVASPAALGFQGNINYSTAEGVSIGGTGISSTGAINNISGTNSFAGAITMTADSSVGVTAGSLELSGGISGSAINLTKVGTGTLTLSGATTYSGTTTVSAGTLSAAAAGALGSTTSVTVNTGGTLLLENALTDRINDSAAIALSDGTLRMPALSGGTSETVGALTLSGTSTLDFNTLNTNTIQFASLTDKPRLQSARRSLDGHDLSG